MTQGGNELRAMIELLQRRRSQWIQPILVVMLLAVLYLMLAPKTYTARALILVDPTHENLLAEESMGRSISAENSRVESEVEILRSPAVALAVIKLAGVADDPEYSQTDGLIGSIIALTGLKETTPATQAETEGRVLNKFRDNNSVRRRGLTHLISVDVKSFDPVRAAELANTMIEVYIEDQLKAKVATLMTVRAAIQFQTSESLLATESANGPRDRLIAKEQYQELLLRLRDLDIQVRLQVPDTRLVSPALPPVKPSNPRSLLVLAIAFGVGAGFGLARVFLVETYLGGVSATSQLSDISGIPVATSIPIVSHRASRFKSIADTIATEPLSRFSDSVRRLRASIDNSLLARQDTQDFAQTKGQLVLVTSAVPSEGKTTLALALGRVYAVSGQTTLLIDADFRKPRVHKAVGLKPKTGLADYLEDSDSGDLPIAEDPKTDLSLLMGAKDSKTATDHLAASANFKTILQMALQNFDVVVLDTPPLLPASDARYMAHLADAAVLAVRHSATKQTVVQDSLAILRNEMPDHAKIFAVLNQDPLVQPEYDYLGYHPSYRHRLGLLTRLGHSCISYGYWAASKVSLRFKPRKPAKLSAGTKLESNIDRAWLTGSGFSRFGRDAADQTRSRGATRFGK